MNHSRIHALLARFARNRSGGVAILFGLSTIPLMLFTGFALDYARGLNYQARLQTAADATALALAKMPSSTPLSTLQTKGRALFAGFYGNGGASDLVVTISTSASGVSVKGASNLKTTMMQIGGIETMPISASSQAVYSKNKIEVALVLDNTGSMAQFGKMPALKAAVNDFITALETIPSDPGAIKMSVVPFNTEVKVGTGYAGLPLRWNVRLENPNLSRIVAPTSAANWTGCLADRDQSYDTQSNGPAGGLSNYVAANCVYSPLAQMVPLTTNLEQVRATANSMQPAGATNLAIGFTTGLATLRNDTPLGGQSSSDPDVQKFLVLLTDGNNTQNRWGGDGSEGNSFVPQIDARMAQACAAARTGATSKVTVFTIRVIEGNAGLLSGCASSPSNYFAASTSADIAPAFKAILNRITNIHLTM